MTGRSLFVRRCRGSVRPGPLGALRATGVVVIVSSIVSTLSGVGDLGVVRAGHRVPAANPVIGSGGRTVDIRDTNGGISRITSIPSSSVFATYGGSTSRCSFVAPSTGTTADGQRFAKGAKVESSRWIFLEGLPESFGEPTPELDGSKGPLADAVRWFTVFCDSTLHGVGMVAVAARDPLFDPHRQLTTLRNRLQLVRSTVFRNPVVDRWGGLVVRYPVWLAISPRAWVARRSNSVRWRGWTMYLLATPVSLDFQVDFTADRSRPSPAFHDEVTCVARGAAVTAGSTALPAMPTLPAQAAPGVNGPCRWTAPGPGTVTFRPIVTYRVTFWVNGYTERLADYRYEGTPSTFRVGELAVVNTDR